MFQKKISMGLCLALSTLLLAGCSSEPSSKDIEAAVSKQMEAVLTQTMSAVTAMSGQSLTEEQKKEIEKMKPKVTINKKKCEKKASDSYECEVEIEMVMGEMTQKTTDTIPMVKKDGVWTATL